MKSRFLALSSSLRSFRKLAVALTLITVAGASPALAQQPTDAQKSVQIRYRQAIDAYRLGKWDESRRLLLGLWQESHTYDVAYALGQAEYQLGHYAAAANYLQFVIANIPPTERLGAAEEYKKNLAELQTKTARVKVGVDQPSADILVDGQSVGASPLASEVYVDPGSHEIEARLGERKAAQSIDASRASVVAVDLKLSPPFDLGTSAMPVVNSGPEESKYDTQHSIEARTVAIWTGVGVTAVSLGIGIGFALKSSSANDDAKSSRSKLAPGDCFGSAASSSSCDALRNSLDERNSANNAETISLAAAAVAAAATTAMFFIWPTHESKSASRVQLVPIAARNTGGLTINGNF